MFRWYYEDGTQETNNQVYPCQDFQGKWQVVSHNFRVFLSNGIYTHIIRVNQTYNHVVKDSRSEPEPRHTNSGAKTFVFRQMQVAIFQRGKVANPDGKPIAKPIKNNKSSKAFHERCHKN